MSTIRGYEPRFKELERQVLQAVPDADVRGAVGRKSSFEVIVNDVEIFSKLTVGKFPSIPEVVEAVKAASNNEEVKLVTGTESCIIL
ncbi:UNVERIFIED_CONTAM: Mien1 [Trichonephila clavipes]